MKSKLFYLFNVLNPIKKWRLLVFFILLISFKFGNCSNGKMEQKIYLVFRFDDFSARSNTNLEQKIIEIFRKNKLAFTIGVIPFAGAGSLLDPTPKGHLPLGEEKGNILKNASHQGVVEVALHGYAHQSHSEQYIGSEFKGLDFEQQKEKILQGKIYLEEISDSKINTFVPPWNQYDDNTLKVLEELQINNISADRFGTMNNKSSIQSLPNSCGLSSLKQAVKSARKSPDKISLIIALFHSYDFIEENKRDGLFNFSDFSELINWISKQNDIKVLTIDQMISELPANYLKNKFELNRKIIAYSFKTPPYIRVKPNYSYASEDYFNLIRQKTIAFYFIIFILTSTIAYLIINSLKTGLMKTRSKSPKSSHRSWSRGKITWPIRC